MFKNKRSLADLVSAFETKNTDTTSGNDDWKKFFHFYKAAVDTTSTVRFLPDLDEDNPRGFVVENLYHELNINGRKERVACLRMHGEDCPACKASEQFYDEKSPNHNPAKGKAMYRKKSYIAQAVVLETTIQMRDDAPLVFLLDFGPQIYNKMIADMKSGDLENNPVEFQGGHNFRIRKSLNGTENSYATSSFSPKPTDLPADMIDQIVDQMYDLKNYRAKRVDAAVMETMVNAALNSMGGPVPQNVAKPTVQPAVQPEQKTVAQQIGDLGVDSPDVGTDTTVSAAQPAPTPAAPAAPASSGQSARDVIRARAAALRAGRGE